MKNVAVFSFSSWLFGFLTVLAACVYPAFALDVGADSTDRRYFDPRPGGGFICKHYDQRESTDGFCVFENNRFRICGGTWVLKGSTTSRYVSTNTKFLKKDPFFCNKSTTFILDNVSIESRPSQELQPDMPYLLTEDYAPLTAANNSYVTLLIRRGTNNRFVSEHFKTPGIFVTRVEYEFDKNSCGKSSYLACLDNINCTLPLYSDCLKNVTINASTLVIDDEDDNPSTKDFPAGRLLAKGADAIAVDAFPPEGYGAAPGIGGLGAATHPRTFIGAWEPTTHGNVEIRGGIVTAQGGKRNDYIIKGGGASGIGEGGGVDNNRDSGGKANGSISIYGGTTTVYGGAYDNCIGYGYLSDIGHCDIGDNGLHKAQMVSNGKFFYNTTGGGSTWIYGGSIVAKRMGTDEVVSSGVCGNKYGLCNLLRDTKLYTFQVGIDKPIANQQITDCKILNVPCNNKKNVQQTSMASYLIPGVYTDDKGKFYIWSEYDLAGWLSSTGLTPDYVIVNNKADEKYERENYTLDGRFRDIMPYLLQSQIVSKPVNAGDNGHALVGHALSFTLPPLKKPEHVYEYEIYSRSGNVSTPRALSETLPSGELTFYYTPLAVDFGTNIYARVRIIEINKEKRGNSYYHYEGKWTNGEEIPVGVKIDISAENGTSVNNASVEFYDRSIMEYVFSYDHNVILEAKPVANNPGVIYRYDWSGSKKTYSGPASINMDGNYGLSYTNYAYRFSIRELLCARFSTCGSMAVGDFPVTGDISFKVKVSNATIPMVISQDPTSGEIDVDGTIKLIFNGPVSLDKGYVWLQKINEEDDKYVEAPIKIRTDNAKSSGICDIENGIVYCDEWTFSYSGLEKFVIYDLYAGDFKNKLEHKMDTALVTRYNTYDRGLPKIANKEPDEKATIRETGKITLTFNREVSIKDAYVKFRNLLTWDELEIPLNTAMQSDRCQYQLEEKYCWALTFEYGGLESGSAYDLIVGGFKGRGGNMMIEETIRYGTPYKQTVADIVYASANPRKDIGFAVGSNNKVTASSKYVANDGFATEALYYWEFNDNKSSMLPPPSACVTSESFSAAYMAAQKENKGSVGIAPTVLFPEKDFSSKFGYWTRIVIRPDGKELGIPHCGSWQRIGVLVYANAGDGNTIVKAGADYYNSENIMGSSADRSKAKILFANSDIFVTNIAKENRASLNAVYTETKTEVGIRTIGNKIDPENSGKIYYEAALTIGTPSSDILISVVLMPVNFNLAAVPVVKREACGADNVFVNVETQNPDAEIWYKGTSYESRGFDVVDMKFGLNRIFFEIRIDRFGEKYSQLDSVDYIRHLPFRMVANWVRYKALTITLDSTSDLERAGFFEMLKNSKNEFDFAKTEWYKGKTLLGKGWSYAVNSTADVEDYSLVLTTKKGNKYYSCKYGSGEPDVTLVKNAIPAFVPYFVPYYVGSRESDFTPIKSAVPGLIASYFGVRIVAGGSSLTLNTPKGGTVSVYTSKGELVSKNIVTETRTTLKMPNTKGMYIVKFTEK